MKIEIKKLYIFPNPQGKVRASVDITIGGLITIYGCSIIEGQNNGYFLSMPQKKDSKQEGKYWSIVFINDKELLEAIRHTVVEEYKKLADGNQVDPVINAEWQE